MKQELEIPQSDIISIYSQMQLIRLFEEESGRQYMRGNIRGFLHLYIGEEAIAVGAIANLLPQDYIFTHYRDHGHALARGMDPNAIMAELFGKATGSSKGKGGSMHLFDASINFMGGYAIVGGQIPLAVGAAFGAKYKGEDSVVLCFLGDGALNEGEFHEAMNLAAIWQLPIIFLCENNLYGMGSPVSKVSAYKEIYRLAEPYGTPSLQIDGMDVLEVRSVMSDVVRKVRNGDGPYFIEALAYRFRGHSMSDPSEYRDKQEEAYWKNRDPITTVRDSLVNKYGVSTEELDAIDAGIDSQVQEAVNFANESPFPDETELYEDIIK